jgi:hypothetical protein
MKREEIDMMTMMTTMLLAMRVLVSSNRDSFFHP